MADLSLNNSVADLVNLIGAAGGLGTAAFGLVDATKAWHWGRYWHGGISNAGFAVLHHAFKPFVPALKAVYRHDPYETLHANWINGVAKADQKAAAKGLIRLGLTPASATALADATGLDGELLAGAASRIATGEALTPTDLNIIGRFDALLSAILDAAYERADQQYRNTCKLWALVAAVVLAWVAGACLAVSGSGGSLWSYFWSAAFWWWTFIGVVATPLAPVAKDLSTALQSAAAAVTAARR
jgi:hypothetical protein